MQIHLIEELNVTLNWIWSNLVDFRHGSMVQKAYSEGKHRLQHDDEMKYAIRIPEKVGDW